MAPKKKVPVVPLFSKLEQEYAKKLLPITPGNVLQEIIKRGGKDLAEKIFINVMSKASSIKTKPTTVREAAELGDKDFVKIDALTEKVINSKPELTKLNQNVVDARLALKDTLPDRDKGYLYGAGENVNSPNFLHWVTDSTPKLRHLKHNLTKEYGLTEKGLPYHEADDPFYNAALEWAGKYAQSETPYLSDFSMKHVGAAADKIAKKAIDRQSGLMPLVFGESASLGTPEAVTYGGMWANYLIDKVPVSFPSKLPKTTNGLANLLSKLENQQSRLSNDDIILKKVIGLIPDSRAKNLPGFSTETRFAWTDPRTLPGSQGGYRPDEWIAESKQITTDFHKTQDWIRKIKDQLSETSPAIQVEGPFGPSWIGKKTGEQELELAQDKFAESMYKLFTNKPGKHQLFHDIRDSSPANKLKLQKEIAKNIDRPIWDIRKSTDFDDPKKFRYDIQWGIDIDSPFMGPRPNFSSFTVDKPPTAVKSTAILQGLIPSEFGLPALSPANKAAFEFLRPYEHTTEGGLPSLVDKITTDPAFTEMIRGKALGQEKEWLRKMQFKEHLMNVPGMGEGLVDVRHFWKKDPKDKFITLSQDKRYLTAFAHMFEIANTAKTDPKSPLLAMSGMADVVQLQPWVVNSSITKTIESKLRKLLEQPLKLTEPGTDYGMKIQKLSDILKKLKTTSIITHPITKQQRYYGLEPAERYKAHELTEKDFFDLINILTRKDFKDMIQYVKETGVGELDITKFNRGGAVDYGEMKDVVPPLDPGERQYLQKGGKGKGKPKDIFSALSQYQAKSQLPKVIGHTTKIFPQLEGPTSVKSIWTVGKENFNDMSSAVKQVMSLSEKYPDQTQKLIMTRGADTAEASYEGGKFIPGTIVEKGSTNIKGEFQPEVVAAQETAIATEVDTPAMVWKAPEAIKNAPIEIGTGKQWNGILKKAGVSPKELDDTSLGPFLETQQPNTKFTKAQVLEEFDNLAPKIEVLTTGKREQGKYLQNILTKFNSVRESISDFSGKDQGVLNSFTGILEKVAGAKTGTQLNVLANQVNRLMKQAYGVDNALMSDQIPAIRQIPAPIRSIFGDMQELFKTRGAAHKFDKRPSHAGDQVLPGGVNYREYVFTYSPNQLRFTEPAYNPSTHTFGFADDAIQNMFVHTRISDRTDNFGRKLLFVEEIQSDMHQKPQKRIREGEESGYATRKDKILSAQTHIDEMATVQAEIDSILAREPNHASLPSLYKKRGTLAAKIEKIRGAVSGGGSIPEGPFQRSEDYGSFVMKYLLRLAKEGNYDGVAVSTGNIKNREGYGSEERKKGHYGFYDKIMQKVMKKIAKNADLEYNRTVINDGAVNWGNVPILILKEIDKVMKGLPSFREGGLNRENFVDVVPLL